MTPLDAELARDEHLAQMAREFEDLDPEHTVPVTCEWYRCNALELLSLRKALRESVGQLAQRDNKIIELRELIHAGTPATGDPNARKSGTRKSRNTRPPRK